MRRALCSWGCCLVLLAVSLTGCEQPHRETLLAQVVACQVAADCNDNNPCTSEICDPLEGCKYTSSSAACDDGQPCTTNDACAQGVCLGGNTATGCTSCQAVATIAPAGGTYTGATGGTSQLRGTCADGTANSPERVFAWRPSVSGTATVETCGGTTNYDTIIYATPGQCGMSGQLACNDDTAGCGISGGGSNAGTLGSRIQIAVTAGTTYFLVVDGWNGRMGNFTLTVRPPTVCGNGVREGVEQCDGADKAMCSATGVCNSDCTCMGGAGLPDLTPSITDVTFDRNADVPAGDVAEGCAGGIRGRDLLRFGVFSTNVGTADLTLGDPNCPNCAQNPLVTCGNPRFICSPASGHNHAHYENYATYELIDGNGQAVALGHKQGFCLRDSVCTTGVSKYRCDNQGITAGCGDEYDVSLGCQYIDVTGIPDGTYTLRVTVDPFSLIPELSEQNNVASRPVTINRGGGGGGSMAPPPEVLPAQGGAFTRTTSGQSFFAASCEPAATAAIPEKVFAWTPSASGMATIKTCSPQTLFDTVVYVGLNADGTNQSACVDDTAGCGTGTGAGNSGRHASTINIAVTAGRTYYIFVDGYEGTAGGSSGQFVLTVTPPAEGSTSPDAGVIADAAVPDAGVIADAATPDAVVPDASIVADAAVSLDVATPPSGNVIPAGGGSVRGMTVATGPKLYTGTCATPESGTAPDQVYEWTPNRSGTATIFTCSQQTTFDTVAYVRTGLATGTELACNDDTDGCAVNHNAPNDFRHGSRLTLAVTAGQKYYLIVDGFTGSRGGSYGQFELTVTPPP